MKTFLVLLFVFLATLTFTAAEGYRVYGNDVLKARPTRWQARAHVTGCFVAGSRGDMNPGVAENDPDYYPKLFQWLDQVGRK